jgi:hypothetical protein
MHSYQNDRLWLINALIDEHVRQAEEARRITRPATSIRRALGTSIVRFGTRLAGEPTYELARSR